MWQGFRSGTERFQTYPAFALKRLPSNSLRIFQKFWHLNSTISAVGQVKIGKHHT
jgi:hypothetical protein